MSDTARAPVCVFAPWDDIQAKPLIQFQNVTKRWGDFTAIDDLSIDIYAQEFFALLGPSGCGKTTMMRMLAGFETPTEGKILIDGQNVAPIPPNKRAVNMMFQSYALFPHLSVADNIAFGLKRDKMPTDQITARIEEMLSLVQLNKFANRKPHQISGGQRQRVALARSLAKAPKLLLLDEPLGALDKKLRQDTQFELMDIQEKTGTTFVIVTHDQEEAMTVASRIAVMDHGKIIQVDTPAKIYEEPRSIYVADFIGDVNLIEGNVSRTTEGHATISWAEGQNELTGIARNDIIPGSVATLAVRPEKLNIYTSRPKDQSNVIKGKVLDIAYLGNMSTYVIETPTGQQIKAQVANTRRIQRRQITWEDKVWLSFTETAGVVLNQ
ncbi:ABC transporter ATP-binding protein [Aliiroseovarius sediminis]|uniref:ABC transporter ATP-binding protein n=1 Tax=Aliiroseovarius sediminis TaxID=2925839 RepID=UPI001F5614F8|nr:ABC transporter ATP-binding protein [Aliiroseovarius sediminis]MCI2395177.1 ABC transporter ATP-binding protein [Aliiroseovarius sediminis]